MMQYDDKPNRDDITVFSEKKLILSVMSRLQDYCRVLLPINSNAQINLKEE